jgi:hypothetical protein
MWGSQSAAPLRTSSLLAIHRWLAGDKGVKLAYSSLRSAMQNGNQYPYLKLSFALSEEMYLVPPIVVGIAHLNQLPLVDD